MSSIGISNEEDTVGKICGKERHKDHSQKDNTSLLNEVKTFCEDMEIPENFIIAANHNLSKAKENYLSTLEWRKEKNVDDILIKPQTKFHVFKALIPWYFHGYDKNGNFVVIQQIAKFDPQKIYENGLTREDALEYTIFFQEYMWNILAPYCNKDKVTVIMDLEGISVYNINSDILSYIKDALTLQSKHWPAKTERSFIINTPSWFTNIYNLIYPWLNERQQKKLTIVDKAHTLETLLKHIPAKELPKEYGGESIDSIGNCILEKNMYKYVEAVMVQHNESYVKLKDSSNQTKEVDAFTATIDSISSSMASLFIPSS